MKESTKVYLIIFLILAVLAFVLSSVCASILDIDNSNAKKLTAIEDDSFKPNEINNVQVIIPKTQNTTQKHTNNTTVITNLTDSIIEIADDAWNELIR
ncbi:hypothetical protein [Methanobrevibacter sp.]|uniref:hypothetical protein n=1 Tax=Methanobrevibacter sp. TaxID=66852 RepID=UPI0025CD5879|nr:hypothetical protein [Methanobrevibacter sp.]MEE0024762.1 hypothetical protein [Methanobrevibacter sp.]